MLEVFQSIFLKIWKVLDDSPAALVTVTYFFGLTTPVIKNWLKRKLSRDIKEGLKIRVRIYNVIQTETDMPKEEIRRKIEDMDTILRTIDSPIYQGKASPSDNFKSIAEEQRDDLKAHLDAKDGIARLRRIFRVTIIPIEKDQEYRIRNIYFHYEKRTWLNKISQFLKLTKKVGAIKNLPTDFLANFIDKTMTQLSPLEVDHKIDKSFEEIFFEKDLTGISCIDSAEREWYADKKDILGLKRANS